MAAYKSIAISSGHGKKVAGASGYVNEVTEARKVVSKVAQYLKQVGVTVHEFHDDTSTTVNNNLQWIVKQHNAVNRELDVSIHFNASKSTTNPMGTEVLYYDHKNLAAEVSVAIAGAGGFKNRGAKERKELYFLKNTTKPAILIEVCFCDSKADVELYNKNFDAICKAIVKALTGKTVQSNTNNQPTQTSPSGSTQKLYRVVCGSFGSRANAERLVAELNAKGYSPFIDIYEKK